MLTVYLLGDASARVRPAIMSRAIEPGHWATHPCRLLCLDLELHLQGRMCGQPEVPAEASCPNIHERRAVRQHVVDPRRRPRARQACRSSLRKDVVPAGHG